MGEFKGDDELTTFIKIHDKPLAKKIKLMEHVMEFGRFVNENLNKK